MVLVRVSNTVAIHWRCEILKELDKLEKKGIITLKRLQYHEPFAKTALIKQIRDNVKAQGLMVSIILHFSEMLKKFHLKVCQFVS